MKKIAQGQVLLTLTASNTIWRTNHKERPAPSIPGRHWYSAAYTLPMQIRSIHALVINGEVVFDIATKGRRSSGVLTCGGTWKVQRRFISGECVSLVLEVQNAIIRKVRKKATKVAAVVEVM